MFIAALFTIAPKWKQPKCIVTDEWTKKIFHNGILLGNKNEMLTHAIIRMTLDHIMLS